MTFDYSELDDPLVVKSLSKIHLGVNEYKPDLFELFLFLPNEIELEINPYQYFQCDSNEDGILYHRYDFDYDIKYDLKEEKAMIIDNIRFKRRK